jgi:hypothetical protein
MTESTQAPTFPPTLTRQERLHHRDLLRQARYEALADAEGFSSICFAVEALGIRLLQQVGDLGQYKIKLADLARDSFVLSELAPYNPGYFSSFESLFRMLRTARNDAMHTGVYARHATTAAIELCIALEEALMKEQDMTRKLVQDFMVKTPITVESWQLVAHARQLMLTHSFSFLPVYIDEQWRLLSEIGLAKFLKGGTERKLTAMPIGAAQANGLELRVAKVVKGEDDVLVLLNEQSVDEGHTLWLVQEMPGRLCGVLSPFELM